MAFQKMPTLQYSDMYAQSPRAEGIHIQQITSTYVTTNL